MIEQDNRPQQNSFYKKLNVLTSLLNEGASDEQKSSSDVSSVPQETEKITFISVNGNNNVITTEKSRCITRPHEKKIPFITGAVLFLLFF